jgi:hypothetical protein
MDGGKDLFKQNPHAPREQVAAIFHFGGTVVPVNVPSPYGRWLKRLKAEATCTYHSRLLRLRWPEVYKCPRCGHSEAYFHSPRHLYQLLPNGQRPDPEVFHVPVPYLQRCHMERPALLFNL